MLKRMTFFLLIITPLLSLANNQPRWPKVLDLSQGELVFYQPQPIDFKRNHLTFLAAVEAKPKNNDKTHFGALTIQCRLDIDKAQNKAFCNDFKLSNINFPVLDKDKKQRFQDFIAQRFEGKSVELSLNEISDALERRIARSERKPIFDNHPPPIYVATKPTALIFIDGEASLRDSKLPGIMQVINTNFVVLFDTKTAIYYLYAFEKWFSAKALTAGWTIAASVPSEFSQFIEKSKSKRTISSSPSRDYVVKVVTKPSALIQLTGKPEYTPMTGTDLMAVTNSDSVLFFQSKAQTYYLLQAGRWYQSQALKNLTTWRLVKASHLPDSFKQLPLNKKTESALVSIPGTTQAEEAIIRNQLPETAIVSKNTQLTLAYDGKPQFKAIKGTDIQYALNASAAVFLFKGHYYANDNGVWFKSASAQGPWLVATTVPSALYDIPSNNPYYYVTYNDVYGENGDNVYVGYTPGYTGSYIDGGTVIYGSGYYYPAWVARWYIGRPLTWLFNYRYRPLVGWYPAAHYAKRTWFRRGVYVGLKAKNPSVSNWMTNQRAIGAAALTGGALGAGLAKRSVYQRWDKGNVKRYQAKKQTLNQLKRRGKNLTPSQRQAVKDRASDRGRALSREQKQARVATIKERAAREQRAADKRVQQRRDLAKKQQRSAKTQVRPKTKAKAKARRNNVYAGRNGQVYRNNKGQWQQRSKQGWSKAKPKNRNLNRQRQARSRQQQARRAPSHRSRSGGARRGGGRRR